MAIGIIVVVLAILLSFIYFWLENNYSKLWKRIIETVIYVIHFWALIVATVAIAIVLANSTS